MRSYVKHARFDGRLLMVGCGSVGQAMLPLLLRHLEIGPAQISVIAADDKGEAIAREFGVSYELCPLTPANFHAVLDGRLQRGDLLLNLSVDVSSLALITMCHARGALYLDTCIEPWAGTYTDPALTGSQRSNYALREAVLAFGRANPVGPTAVLTQGANPGLASAFVKQALLNLAADAGQRPAPPARRGDWARLAQRLGVRVIHIAERDTQLTPRRKAKDEFVNTWSVDGFMAEGRQPAELGWGTHERHWPADASRHGFGSDAAIYLRRPGAATRVRSWTPLEGPYHGFLITHAESISIADHLTLKEGGAVRYRPTVHYAYYPCDDAVLSLHEAAGHGWRPQPRQHILRDEITQGMDELGVLLMGHARGAYWYGSRLTIGRARRLVPHNSATSLQVVAGVLAGMVWALRHPQAGVVEPEDLDHDLVLSIAGPYLGDLVGVYGDWTPLQNRGWLFDETLDRDDPWQFVNFRVD
ncbi:MAG TPA: saccharopine dehydrogenase C-terminal domain-containing protein [Burkholderiaceae bacterium]|nr:saccharopine dehydrogenase C-terminal domain-containing protein [Burkholderiaceae bacterium]